MFRRCDQWPLQPGASPFRLEYGRHLGLRSPQLGRIFHHFAPEGSGRPATATTAAGCVFSLTTVDASGAMPGKYKVTVDKVEYGAGGSSSMEAASIGNAAEGTVKRALPAKYAEVASTPLAIEVPSGGKKDIDLALVD